MSSNRTVPVVTAAALLVLASACGGADDDSGAVADTSATLADLEPIDTDALTDGDTIDEPAVASDPADRVAGVAGLTCDEQAALFAAGPSVNPDLADPEASAVCDGDSIVVTSNGIPDYTYIETSPGSPRAADHVFTIPAEPEMASETTDVPGLGTAAVSLTGIPIYGPTEGTGGDVLDLDNLSDCGSHNGPTGFHIHLLGTSETTDCLFAPAEVATEPQLVGYAFDGYPIYTGNDQYTSSWELTDASLFATDTWAAHSYVEGSGDLDECNGRVDGDGNYAYYTTDTFPYVLGCYSGVVDLDGAGGGGGGGGGAGGPGGPPAGG
ncbi:MAG: YHYH protein [Actinomycetota bacterium]